MKPPGWPVDLVEPNDPDFDPRVVRWLLDRLPGEIRQGAVAKDASALVWLVAEQTSAQIELYRSLYARARGQAATETVDPLLEAISAVGANLVRQDREIALVAREIGRLWALHGGQIQQMHLD
ncbi:MAG: hypothetical protein WBJ33_05515 [Candidatus Nanopelagicales bacterium]